MTAPTTLPPRPPDPGLADPHPPTTPRRPRTGTIVLVLALVVMTIAAVGALALTTGTVEADVIRPTTDVTHVEIDIDGGSITVAPAEELSVGLQRRGWIGNDVTDDITDGVLRVTGTCRLVNLGRCNTAVTVELPPGVRISMATGAGSISGTAAHGWVEAVTDAGSIDLTVTAHIHSLSATTDVGSIDLRVPDTTYAVDGGTTFGQTRVDVRTDGAARGAIHARAEVGDVTVRTIAGAGR